MELRRIFDALLHQKEQHPLQKSLGYNKDGKWTYFSTQQVYDMAVHLAGGLLNLGIQPGEKVAIAAYKNRPEWTITDVATQMIGVINVPLYPTISPREYEYILNDAGVKYAFVGAMDLYDKVAEAQANVSTLETIYTFDRQDGRPYWEDIFDASKASEVEAASANVKTDDLATIIYTSGTTGNPKGVMLTHKNITSNIKNVKELLPLNEGQLALSFLPLCHIFERTASFSYLYNCIEVVFTGTDNLGGDDGDLKAIRPNFFTTVPRLLEKVYEKIYNKGLELTGVKKSLFFWALGLTEDYAYDKQYSGLAKIRRNIADKLIFSKWREALGGRVEGILTGAAPCPVKMAQVFSAAGIPIREGYGLTETSPGLTIGRYDKGGALLGTVGPALPGVDIIIDPSDGHYREGEGEILAKGDNIMQGYYNKPDATAAVFKEMDGATWFCTGDVGKFVKGPDGSQFLKITDRKKELLKTSGGKYVAPAPIENKMKEDFLVEQIMVIGDKRKFVSAIIVPAEEALKDWCENNGVSWSSCSEAIKDDKVIAAYQAVIDRFNPEFSHIEQVKKFELVASQWEPIKTDGTAAELTPTMKLKRRVIREKYADIIDGIYAD